MSRVLPFAGAATAVLAVGVALSAATGVEDACAQGTSVAPRIECPTAAAAPQLAPAPGSAAPCRIATPLLTKVSVRSVGGGLRVSFRRGVSQPVRVDVFQASAQRRVVGQRLVFRRSSSASPVAWNGRRQARRAAPSDGIFFVRVSIRDARGRTDTRRLALRRDGRRFSSRRAFARRDSCAALRSFKLERPVFGGAGNRAVGVSFRVAEPGRVEVELRRGGRTVRRLSAAPRSVGTLHRLRLASEGLPRGTYEVRLRLIGRAGTPTSTLSLARV